MMGTVVLITVFLIELIVMIHCFGTKTSTERLRNLLGIAALAVFSLLALTGKIEWSFRWYGPVLLVFIWSGIAFFRLWSPGGEVREHRAGRVILRSVAKMLLVTIAILLALLFPEYELPAPTGKFAVASVQYTFVDEERVEDYPGLGGNRKLSVECWHPENVDGKYPLVVFSHGGIGTKRSNVSLFRELASHGYIVCSTDHPYHSFRTEDDEGNATFLSMDYLLELLQEDAKTDKRRSFEYYQKWMRVRTSDINLVLDTILKNASDSMGGVYDLVDAERLGVMGHSLGGSAALGIPRQRDDIDAVIALESPFLYDIVDVENDAFVFNQQAYPVPVLNIYSDSSWEHLSEWAQYARNYDFFSAPQTTAFNLHIGGAGHFSMTDLVLFSPTLVTMLEGREGTWERAEYLQEVNRACLDFLDAHLKETYKLDGLLTTIED